MRQMVLIAAAAAMTMAAAGCGSNSSPTTPTNAPTVFTVQLSPANEVPPITNAESTARGTATITINATRDSSGAVTGGTIDFNVQVSGFPASTANLSAAHIHNGPAGVAAGVFLDTSIGSTVAINNGAGSFTVSKTPTADQIGQILANPAGFYFNVHTPANPSGVLRGQLK